MSDRTFWTAEEDAHLRAQVATGLSVPKIARKWPQHFAKRSVPALNMRKATLGLTGLPPAQETPEVVTQVQSVKVEQDGDSLSVTTNGLEVRTLDELIARAKVDMSVWEVDKPQTRMWEVKVRGEDGAIKNAQNFYISASFKRKLGPSTQEQVEAMIAGAFAKRKPIVGKVPKVVKSDLMQAAIIADPHIGKLAWPDETGREPWDTAISVDVVRRGVTANMAEGDKRGIAERRFVLLGDFYHHDGRGMTTNGTVMDYDTRVQKMLRAGSELLCDLITESAKSVFTKVYIVPGNHDRVLGWALQLILQTEFKRHGGVVVDDSYTPTKFMSWGRCLIGMDHGDKGKTRLPAHMANQCEAEWGQSICREILTGHLHSKAAIQTINGILVRTQDALCPPDLYHAEEKFTANGPRTIEAITYNKGGVAAHTDVWSPDLNRAPRKGTV